MKILVTGSNGFLGRNLVTELKLRGYDEILEYERTTPNWLLDRYAAECDFVFHLAGANEPKEESELMKVNFGFTLELLKALESGKSRAAVVMASSIEASLDTPYGKSKKAGENLLFAYGKETSAKTVVYRFPSIFGKWSKIEHSIVADFCHNVARHKPLTIENAGRELALCYVDDVVEELVRALEGVPNREGNFGKVPVEHTIKLGILADTILGFRESRHDLHIPDMSDPLTEKLYATYTSFLPEDDLLYTLIERERKSGYFVEFLKSNTAGQISIDVLKPSAESGNHWHRGKHQKFLVVCGEGAIKLRQIHAKEAVEYRVSAKAKQVVDIPPGYSHVLVNTGDADLVAVIWSSEVCSPEEPDTYTLKV